MPAGISWRLKETPGHSGSKKGFRTPFSSCWSLPFPSPAMASICSSLSVKARVALFKIQKSHTSVSYLELVLCGLPLCIFI